MTILKIIKTNRVLKYCTTNNQTTMEYLSIPNLRPGKMKRCAKFVISMKIICGTKLFDTIDIFHCWPNFILYLPSVINVMKRNKKIPKNIDIANNAINATVISMHFPVFVFSSRTIFRLFWSKWFARLLEAHRYCVSSAA